MAELRERLDRDQTFLQALQSRVDALTSDFVNRDDPAQRGQIAGDRQKTLAELDRLRKAIEADKRSIPDLEEEARRSGVPAGWLRYGWSVLWSRHQQTSSLGQPSRAASPDRGCSLMARRASDPPILLVEDKDSLRAMLRLALEAQGHDRDRSARSARGRCRRFVRRAPGVVLVGPAAAGGRRLRRAARGQGTRPRLPVIVMTAYGSIQDAVAAMKEGALDFLAKPVDPDHLLLLVERALAQRRLPPKHPAQGRARARRGAPQIIGEDPRLKQVLTRCIARRPPTPPCCIEGESGTGKELFARALHALSPRADGPFVAINCAAIPETLLETELFGHEKGAFTGASPRKPGKFELAHRGTLFLDEIGDLPLALQAKILRALEEKQFERVGGTALASRRRAHGGGHEPEPEGSGGGAAVSRRPVLPPVGLSDHRCRRCATARATFRCWRRYFVDRFCRDLKKKPLSAGAVGDRELWQLRLARQRARAAELHRTCGDPVGRRRHSAAPPESSSLLHAAPATVSGSGKPVERYRSLGHARRRVTARRGRGGAPQVRPGAHDAAGNAASGRGVLQMHYKAVRHS